MAARDTERYYWLKLHKDFFKRHDITVIEDMPNGKDYVLFYLKLMLESIDHEGALRFSDTIPYSESMLASVTHTNVDVVRPALKLLTAPGMVEVFDDKTLFMTEVAKLLDSETYAAKRKRLQREKEEKGDIFPRLSPVCPQEIEKDIEIEKEKEKEIKSDKPAPEEKPKRKRQPFVPPTFEEVAAYCVERKNSVDPKKFFDYYTAGNWKDSRGDPVKNWKQKLITWERRDNDRRERDSQDDRKGKPRGKIHYD